MQVVCQSDAIPGLNFEHLVFAVAVERSPLNGSRLWAHVRSPVEGLRFAMVTNFQLATLVSRREADDERTKLVR